MDISLVGDTKIFTLGTQRTKKKNSSMLIGMPFFTEGTLACHNLRLFVVGNSRLIADIGDLYALLSVSSCIHI
jgi:hypothetical protein